MSENAITSRKASVLRLASASAFCFLALLSSVMMIFVLKLYFYSPLLVRLFFAAHLMWFFGDEEELQLEFKADADEKQHIWPTF